MIFRKSKRIRELEEKVEELRTFCLHLRERLDHVCPGAFDSTSPFREEQERVYRTHYEKRQAHHKKDRK
jgi:hypothetical protein